ncbi:hypothetical protein LINPERPRIM_LOCUS31721 [Linum perenne]
MCDSSHRAIYNQFFFGRDFLHTMVLDSPSVGMVSILLCSLPILDGVPLSVTSNLLCTRTSCTNVMPTLNLSTIFLTEISTLMLMVTSSL